MGLAISLPPTGLPLADATAYATEAIERGYRGCWIAEVGGNDAFALGAAVGQAVDGVPIGTAVVPVNTRGPAMLAMAASTMHAVCGERGICGIGVSSEQIVSDWNDQPSDKPLTRARETIEVLRQMFSGEKVAYEGTCVRVSGYRMMPAPPSPPPIYLGALNHKMLRLAGAHADGVILNMLGEGFVPTVLAEVRKGATDAGRDPDSLEVVMRVQCCVTDDVEMVRDGFARAFGAYIVARGYDRFFEWQGFGESVEGVRKAFAARDREAARAAISDELLDALVVAGSAEEVRGRLEAFMEAGVTTPAVHAFWPAPDSAWETMRGVAPGS